MKTILSFSAKCSDSFGACLTDKNGSRAYEGYVPDFFPEGGGDCVEMSIDVETGQILNWVKPSAKDLNQIFKK